MQLPVLGDVTIKSDQQGCGSCSAGGGCGYSSDTGPARSLALGCAILILRREATTCVQSQCPGNPLSPFLRQQGELWWCPLPVLWGDRVGQWCLRDGIPCLKASASVCLGGHKEWGSLLQTVLVQISQGTGTLVSMH